jgi:hypothetical protein
MDCIFTDTTKINFMIFTNARASVFQTVMKGGKQPSQSCEQPETTFGEDNPKRVHCDTDQDSLAKECLPTHPTLSF